MQNHTSQALKRARQQRRAMSLPEGLLWQQLRQRPLGVKFRNHHPIGHLVVDFFCASRRLAIEIDGIAHNMGDNPARDSARDKWLREEGCEVLRIPATDVLRDPAATAEAIARYCAAPPPPAADAATTSPAGGASFGETAA